jgi:acetyltransferase-like isoleucine patch superfamily enzyme
MSLRRLRQRGRRLRARSRAWAWRLLRPGVNVGRGVLIGSACRLFLDAEAVLILGAGCEIDDGTTIAVYDRGRLEMGPASFAGHGCTLAARSLVQIGAGTFLAELVSVRDHDHVVGMPPSSGAMSVDPIIVGRDVWIGAKTTVLRGARIGDGCVVGANAVVHGDLPGRSVCVGIPARVVRTIGVEGKPE